MRIGVTDDFMFFMSDGEIRAMSNQFLLVRYVAFEISKIIVTALGFW